MFSYCCFAGGGLCLQDRIEKEDAKEYFLAGAAQHLRNICSYSLKINACTIEGMRLY